MGVRSAASARSIVSRYGSRLIRYIPAAALFIVGPGAWLGATGAPVAGSVSSGRVPTSGRT